MDTTRFKQLLEEDKAVLEHEMRDVGQPNPGVPTDWEVAPPEVGMEADPIDQADIVTNQETNASILADLEARYDSVLAALGRIEKGTYGTCTVCGKQIELARLEADPAASTCIEHV
jgi:RNA polymerase-binding transcription factor DksA